MLVMAEAPNIPGSPRNSGPPGWRPEVPRKLALMVLGQAYKLKPALLKKAMQGPLPSVMSFRVWVLSLLIPFCSGLSAT